MKFNEDKCHLISSGTGHTDPLSIKIRGTTIQESNQEKLFGVIIDNGFTFEELIGKLCQKISNKLYVLGTFANLLLHKPT